MSKLKIDISVYRQHQMCYFHPKMPARAWEYGVFRRKFLRWELLATFDSEEEARAFRYQIRSYPLVSSY